MFVICMYLGYSGTKFLFKNSIKLGHISDLIIRIVSKKLFQIFGQLFKFGFKKYFNFIFKLREINFIQI